ncbi:glycosyltransferase family 2 protein [Pediococcus parvulus]|uniref:glycosyltransferase family 2 protein n=1 Tax=Pediococcus parvulus TaxID=54062 RepID=UPI0021A68150|nr:glycosyltransferase [Pediococcus parvulus]MCT3031118.1 glycosyltransferase [Pediococcus parvulus]
MTYIKEKGKVSIIIPVYNAERYLEECVNSILGQTYHDLQIILINDGSTDNSWKICQKLMKRDSRITIYSQKNSGVSVARNKGLELSDGQWIMFVDPDDILNLNMVAALLSKFNENRDIVACACYGFNSKRKITDHFFYGNRLFQLNKLDLYLQLMDSTYGQPGEVVTAIGVPWGKIYRRHFIEKNKLRFDPKLRRMQDNIFNMYAFYYARDIYYVDELLYMYRLDHISNYGDRNLKIFEKIFLPVIEARYNGLKKLHLFDNTQIYKGYINEAATCLSIIIKEKIMVGKKLGKVQNQIKLLSTKPRFKLLLEYQGIKNIQNKKIKLKILCIKYKLIWLYVLLYKLWKAK